MNKNILILTLLLFVGLVTAIGFGPYYVNKLNKANCMDNYVGDLEEEAFFVPEGAFGDVLDGMADAWDTMIDCALEEDMACFNSAYADYTSLVNQGRFLYLYYGFMFYIEETEGDPEFLEELLGIFYEEQYDLMDCYVGGLD